VASTVRLSKWHLDRLLRRATGRCFVAHLNEARLCAACSLLPTDSLSAKEVAAKVGYGSLTAMDRQFKRSFASTPTKWREAQRND
jgi:AraC-like DNA-binding protein